VHTTAAAVMRSEEIPRSGKAPMRCVVAHAPHAAGSRHAGGTGGAVVPAGPRLEIVRVPDAVLRTVPTARGLHLSTFLLNVSAFCGTGGSLRNCLGVCVGCLGIS